MKYKQSLSFHRLEKRSISISIAEEYAKILKNVGYLDQSFAWTWKFKVFNIDPQDYQESPTQKAANRLFSQRDKNEYVKLALSFTEYEKIERQFYKKKSVNLYPKNEIKTFTRLVNLLNEKDWENALLEYEKNYM